MEIKHRFYQLVRYGMTGGTAAVVDLGAFSALCPAVLPVALAATVSFVLSAAVNYGLSSVFVFNSAIGARKFSKFLAVAAVGLVFNVTVTVAVVDLASVPPPLAKMTGTASAFLLNYLLNIAVVFRDADARRRRRTSGAAEAAPASIAE